jgi:large subunit ribosomal protein L4
METKIYNIQGKEAGTVKLPENIFGLPWNADLVHQVVTAMRANARGPIAHTKDRGEVRGGGKKPWAQKGTGRARHGSSRSPIWKGGGVTHGPRNDKSYTQKINKQARQKALLVTLSRKFKDGEIIFIDSLEMNAPKTKDARAMLTAISKHIGGFKKKHNAALIALPTAHTLQHKRASQTSAMSRSTETATSTQCLCSRQNTLSLQTRQLLSRRSRQSASPTATNRQNI